MMMKVIDVVDRNSVLCLWASYSHLCALAIKQYYLLLVSERVICVDAEVSLVTTCYALTTLI